MTLGETIVTKKGSLFNNYNCLSDASVKHDNRICVVRLYMNTGNFD